METVTIPKAEYEKLLEDQFWLERLENTGVDNWEGYDEAINIFKEGAE